MAKELIGTVSHYYDKIGVAIVELSGSLKKGDDISIEKDSSILEQKVESMQIEKKAIDKAKKGDAIGLKVSEPVKEGSQVFKVTE